MKKYKPIQKFISQTILAVFCLAAPTLMTGCDDHPFEQWLNATNQARVVAKGEWPVFPYRQRQHQALKNYFSQISQLALNLRNDQSYVTKFNEAVAQGNLQDICSKAFLPRYEWLAIMEHCQKNRFFLCAEEVRAYPEIVAFIRTRLNSVQQRRFGQAISCQTAQ